MTTPGFTDIDLSHDDHHVAVIEIRRPPYNFFDFDLIQQIADALEWIDGSDACRVSVLCAHGKAFCAGANFGDGSDITRDGSVAGNDNKANANHLYREAVRLYRAKKPMVAAVHGAAIGGGLGLAMVADFRVSCPEAKFAANFSRLGFTPGFGLTVRLPEVIGNQHAAMMFYTGRRIAGDEAHAMGLADMLVERDDVRTAAQELAREIAVSSPLAVVEIRNVLRAGLADRIEAATDVELATQTRLRRTDDFIEGVKATAERRDPVFNGR